MNAMRVVKEVGLLDGIGVIIEDDFAPASKPSKIVEKLMQEVKGKGKNKSKQTGKGGG